MGLKELQEKMQLEKQVEELGLKSDTITGMDSDKMKGLDPVANTGSLATGPVGREYGAQYDGQTEAIAYRNNWLQRNMYNIRQYSEVFFHFAVALGNLALIYYIVRH